MVGLYFRLTTARALPALPGGCSSKFKSAKGSADAGSDTSPWPKSSSDITSASGEVIADGALAVVGKLPCVLDANDASGVKNYMRVRRESKTPQKTPKKRRTRG